MFRCSECRKPIGLMVDPKGRPELFKCPRSGRVGHMVDERGYAVKVTI